MKRSKQCKRSSCVVMVGGGVQLSKPKKVAPHIIFRDSLKSYGISVKVAIYVEYIIRK